MRQAAASRAEHRPAKCPHPLQELVEYYQSHSLKESFKQLDTTLKYPYKSRERSTSRTFTRSPGKTRLPRQASSCSWCNSSWAWSEQGGYGCSLPDSVLAAFPLVVSHTRDFWHRLVQRECTGSCRALLPVVVGSSKSGMCCGVRAFWWLWFHCQLWFESQGDSFSGTGGRNSKSANQRNVKVNGKQNLRYCRMFCVKA